VTAMGPPSLAIIGGAVWAPGEPKATAVAVAGERISAAGSDSDIRALIGRGTRVVEARGGSILPAFNDAHIHFLSGSRGLGELDLFGAETQPDVERRIRDYLAGHTGAGWVIGRGWVYAAFPGGMPDIELLDRLIPDTPAYLEAYDGHTAWVNSRALAAARAGPASRAGILKEAAMEDFERHLPQHTREDDLEALRVGMRLAASKGIASIQEASRGLDQLPLYDALRETNQLTLRVRLAFDMAPGHTLEEWRRRLDVLDEAARGRRDDPWIAARVIKAFADGVVESKTASLLEPYPGMAGSEPGACGSPNWEARDLAEAAREASARGWQVEIHAIGDRAIRESLDALSGCERSRRHRIEHIEAPAPEDIGRFGAIGVIASMQPQHAEPNKNLMEAWAPNLGPVRAGRGWPWASIQRAGGALAFGSDWPVVPIDPLFSLHVAVHRQTLAGDPPGGWVPGERLSLADAIAAWTHGAAFAEHREHEKGRLRPGMLADIALLDRDLANTPAVEIAQAKVEATVVGGRLVYEG
jgi:predicted amidohydrolase YtcJ